MKKIDYLLLLIALIVSVFAACNKEDRNLTADPLNNGSSERNMIVVISDLHMGADLAYSQLNGNLKPLEKFLNNVKASPNVRELVIGGDLVDEWFVPANVDTYGGKDQRDFVGRLAVANKGAIDAFNSIIQQGNIKVTYVPGNHDLTITSENIEFLLPGINQARYYTLGLGTYEPDCLPQLAIEHGHRYNFFCAPDMHSNQDVAPGTVLPPGYFFTRIAALHVVQNCSQNLDVIPNITPNLTGGESQNLLYQYSNIWTWTMGMFPVNNHFNEDIIVTNIDGFTGNYSIDDLLPYQSAEGGPIDVNLFNGIQDSWDTRQALNHVAVHISADHAITCANSANETDSLALTQYFLNPESGIRIVVFGHNHRAAIIPYQTYNGMKAVYANSGTWIDNNSVGSTANFVIITPQENDASSLTKVELYNFVGEAYTKMAADSLRL
jgi:UDP-2,3-diacylglucosamine pyrophosphatase LpxH